MYKWEFSRYCIFSYFHVLSKKLTLNCCKLDLNVERLEIWHLIDQIFIQLTIHYYRSWRRSQSECDDLQDSFWVSRGLHKVFGMRSVYLALTQQFILPARDTEYAGFRGTINLHGWAMGS